MNFLLLKKKRKYEKEFESNNVYQQNKRMK